LGWEADMAFRRRAAEGAVFAGGRRSPFRRGPKNRKTLSAATNHRPITGVVERARTFGSFSLLTEAVPPLVAVKNLNGVVGSLSTAPADPDPSSTCRRCSLPTWLCLPARVLESSNPRRSEVAERCPCSRPSVPSPARSPKDLSAPPTGAHGSFMPRLERWGSSRCLTDDRVPHWSLSTVTSGALGRTGTGRSPTSSNVPPGAADLADAALPRPRCQNRVGSKS